MKNLLFCLLLLPIGLQAQVYVPFISTADSSDAWIDIYSCTDFSCFESYTNSYKIDGDTTIGSFQYSKVYIKIKDEEGSAGGQWCTESVNYYERYFGALRENEKQVFLLRGLQSVSEYLAYDFNLSIGDTLPQPDGPFLPSDPAGRIINEIDSVLVFDNYRKRFISNNNYVIEGIGASTGLFNPLTSNANTSGQCDVRMLCYAEYETPDYFLQNCNFNLVNVSAIERETATPVLVKIVDLMGRKTLELPNTPLIYIYNDGTTKKVFNFE